MGSQGGEEGKMAEEEREGKKWREREREERREEEARRDDEVGKVKWRSREVSEVCRWGMK